MTSVGSTVSTAAPSVTPVTRPVAPVQAPAATPSAQQASGPEKDARPTAPSSTDAGLKVLGEQAGARVASMQAQQKAEAEAQANHQIPIRSGVAEEMAQGQAGRYQHHTNGNAKQTADQQLFAVLGIEEHRSPHGRPTPRAGASIWQGGCRA